MLPVKLVQYSNGWGHLIMSLFFGGLAAALILIPSNDATTKGIGFGLIGTVSSAWFIPSAAKQVIYQLQKTQPLPTQEQGVTNAPAN